MSFAEWAEPEVLEKVLHRPYVFTLPKMLRIYFEYDRQLLGKLSPCAYPTVKEFFPAVIPDKDDPQKRMELFRPEVFKMWLAEEKITPTHVQKWLPSKSS